MGNESCDCYQEKLDEEQFKDRFKVNKIVSLKAPRLSGTIKYHLERFKPFQDDLSHDKVLRKFEGDIYDGPINIKGKPSGIGKLYKKNGSVFIGNFQNGIADGMGHYVQQDGSFYHGYFLNNKANCENGEFQTFQVKYKGGVKNNQLNGQGCMTGENFTFKGNFYRGRKTKGILKWKVKGKQEEEEEWIYNGQFDDNQNFDGNGILTNNKGVYKGNFYKGQKSGIGEFTFKNAKYKGQYKRGYKHGKGMLSNLDNSLIYNGDWKDGIPHGQGIVINSFGDEVKLEWVQGLDSRILPQSKNIFLNVQF